MADNLFCKRTISSRKVFLEHIKKSLNWLLIITKVGYHSSAYNYDLEYVKRKHNLLADPLSRLPLHTTNVSTNEQAGYSGALLNICIGDLPISKKEIQRLT